jgi:hypothetical protein
VDEPTEVQLGELAQGLGYWAARHAEPQARVADPDPAAGQPADLALRELTATMAGLFADRAPRPPIPLVHTITVPAAIRLMLPHLPPELHDLSYRCARLTTTRMLDAFSATLQPAPLLAVGSAPPLERTVADAVDSGDEHAIKLAEACVREHAANPDERLLRAGATLTRMIRG